MITPIEFVPSNPIFIHNEFDLLKVEKMRLYPDLHDPDDVSACDEPIRDEDLVRDYICLNSCGETLIIRTPGKHYRQLSVSAKQKAIHIYDLYRFCAPYIFIGDKTPDQTILKQLRFFDIQNVIKENETEFHDLDCVVFDLLKQIREGLEKDKREEFLEVANTLVRNLKDIQGVSDIVAVNALNKMKKTLRGAAWFIIKEKHDHSMVFDYRYNEWEPWHMETLTVDFLSKE